MTLQMQVCCFIAACDLVVIGIALSVCQSLHLTVTISALTVHWQPQADHLQSDHTSACLSSSHKWKDATRFPAELLHRGAASFQAYKHVTC